MAKVMLTMRLDDTQEIRNAVRERYVFESLYSAFEDCVVCPVSSVSSANFLPGDSVVLISPQAPS